MQDDYLFVLLYCQKFGNSKNISFCIILDLLDNIIPAILNIYTTLFQGNHFSQYIETLFRLWTIMKRFHRKNYDKVILAFLSDFSY